MKTPVQSDSCNNSGDVQPHVRTASAPELLQHEESSPSTAQSSDITQRQQCVNELNLFSQHLGCSSSRSSSHQSVSNQSFSDYGDIACDGNVISSTGSIVFFSLPMPVFPPHIKLILICQSCFIFVAAVLQQIKKAKVQ